ALSMPAELCSVAGQIIDHDAIARSQAVIHALQRVRLGSVERRQEMLLPPFRNFRWRLAAVRNPNPECLGGGDVVSHRGDRPAARDIEADIVQWDEPLPAFALSRER